MSSPPPARDWSLRGPRLRGAAVALFLVWLVGYPLAITVREAFGLDGFTTAFFAEFVHRADEWRALGRTLWVAVLSVIFSAVVGVPLAFVFERGRFFGRRLLGALVALPVALPPLVGVIAFLFLYGESGFVARALQGLGWDVEWRLQGLWAILLVHTYSMYVYFYLFVRSALSRFDHSLLEAAASLGASPIRVFFRVQLPLLRPAVVSASLLVFMTSLASFSAPYIFGGNYRVMTTQITASKLNGQVEMTRVETVALMSLALFGLLLVRWFDRGGSTTVAQRGVARWRGAEQLDWLGSLGAWILAAFLLLPHLTLVLLSLVPANTWTTEALPPVLSSVNYRELFSEAERLRPIVNSLWMATTATLLAVTIGLVGGRVALRVKGVLGRSIENLLALPWAVPGTVFAVALATTMSVHQPWAGRFLWIGTAWILPVAYLVRSLPLTSRSALAGLRQIDPRLEEAAADLGAGSLRTLGRVVLPLVGPALLAGAGLAFVTALGDFVTSILLYSYDTRPISVEILSSLRLQQTGIAAAYGVLLMVLGTLVFLLWGRDRDVRT